VLAPDVRVALAPDRYYQQLIAADEPIDVWRMLHRPLIVALVIGTAVPIMAVQRVTLGLLVSSAVSFSFVVAIQIAVGAVLVASAASRRVRMARALDLWFAGHVPYSLWLLVAAGAIAAMPAAGLDGLIAVAVIPSVWTAVVVAAFCRHVLGTSKAGARVRATAHFLAMWAIALQVVAVSAGGWFQVWAPIARVLQ
jgi:hypothetical protein